MNIRYFVANASAGTNPPNGINKPKFSHNCTLHITHHSLHCFIYLLYLPTPTYRHYRLHPSSAMAQPTLPLRLAIRTSRPNHHHEARSYFHACRTSSLRPQPRVQPQPQPQPQQSTTTRPPSSLNHTLPTRRLFSNTNTTAAPVTIVRQNPRVDDDGHDMTIEISERAAKVRKARSVQPNLRPKTGV
jgi:hypothetical protein